MPKIKRPQNLDKRVFFGRDPSDHSQVVNFIRQRYKDVLILRVHYLSQEKKSKWQFEFDIFASGKSLNIAFPNLMRYTQVLILTPDF